MSTNVEQIQVLDLTIDIVKKDIKNMHLAVYPPTGRVRIASPYTMNDEAIRLFAISKIRWIKKHQTNFYNQLRELPKEYITGESHYFNGTRYLLNVIERYGKHEIVVRNKKYLDMYISPNANIQSREKVFSDWYRSYLKETIPSLIARWEAITGVVVAEWEIKKMLTKWGSCNEEKKKIIINLELAKKPTNCLEYVIVHEMTHFFERNHSDRFSLLLDKFMPNWRAVKSELNKLPVGYAV